jgi:large subunit ribosomal protein L25
LNIECLPDAIPNKVEADLSSLTEEGQAIHVKDIKIPSGITVLDHPGQPVARISVPRVKEEEKIEAPEGAAEPAEPREEDSPSTTAETQ